MTAPNAIALVDFLAKLAATLLGLFCLVFALLTRGGRDESLDEPPIEPDDVQRQRALRLVNDTTPDERRRNATNN